MNKVEFKTTGEKMLYVAKKLPDQGFFIRMNSIPNASDAVANDVKYHMKCWVNAQRATAKSTKEDGSVQEIEDVKRVIADIDIIDIVKSSVNDQNELLNMNNINLLGIDEDAEANYKRYLKNLLAENIGDIEFTRPPSRLQSERVCSKSYRDSAIHEFESIPDSYTTRQLR